MSMSVEFQDMDFEMVQLSGAWARERYVKERKLEMGIQAIQGINGTGLRRRAQSVSGTEKAGCHRAAGRSLWLQSGIQRQLPGSDRGFHL